MVWFVVGYDVSLNPFIDYQVFVSNHPQLAGGSHLPDITVITPVFHKGEIIFFVASRGHHADIGGKCVVAVYCVIDLLVAVMFDSVVRILVSQQVSHQDPCPHIRHV